MHLTQLPGKSYWKNWSAEKLVSHFKMIHSYLSGRIVLLSQGVEMQVGGGVPQDSVLGPTLWNILYDDVMELQMHDGVKIICFADDLAVVAVAEDGNSLKNKIDDTLHKVKWCVPNNHLQMAEEKTQAILCSNFKRDRHLRFTIGNHEIELAIKVQYLGIIIEVCCSRITYRRYARKPKGQCTR